jgi:acyl carrier protein
MESNVDSFLHIISQTLECESEHVSLNDTLLKSPLWDSMSQLVIAAWIHKETGNIVSVEELKAAKTIGDLKAIYASKI